MIPLLQQMFLPAMGAADLGAVVSDVFDPNAFKIAAQATDANLMGGFAAVFVAQELPKLQAKDPVLGEHTDIPAEVLIDAGALFAQPMPNSAAPPLSDAPMAPLSDPIITTAALDPAEPSILPDLGETAADILDKAEGIQNTEPPLVSKGAPSTDPMTHANVLAPPKTVALQSVALQTEATIAPEKIVTAPKAKVFTGNPMIPLPHHTLATEILPQEVLAPVSPQIGQVPQILAIFPTPMVPSMAESMFQTQIDAQDVTTALPVAVQSKVPSPPTPLAVLPSDPVFALSEAIDVMPLTVAVQTMQVSKAPSAPFAEPIDDVAVANLDLGQTASPLSQDSPMDLVQNLVQNLGADRQPLATKAEAVPLQNAQTPAALPNLPAPQLAAQILPHSNAAKTGPIEVLLNPAELGHLRFEIHQKGEHVQVVLSAERPETLDLLRRNGEQLTAEFRSAGFSGASLSFGQWGRSSDGQPPASFVTKAEDDFATVVLPPSAKPPMAQDNSRNLNLRL